MMSLRNFCLWAGGYPSKMVEQLSCESTEQVAKLGAAVLLSSFIAMLNWAAAGWLFSDGLIGVSRVFVIFLVGFLGSSIVLILDRSFLYFADIGSSRGGVGIFYGALRMVIVLLIASMTSLAVMPILFKAELTSEILRLQDASEMGRKERLESKFDIHQQKLDLNIVDDQLVRLGEKLTVIPDSVSAARNGYQKCWRMYQSRKTVLRKAGHSETVVGRKLARKASECHGQEKRASDLLNEYVLGISANIDELKGKKHAAELHLSKDSEKMRDEFNQGNAMKASSLTLGSSEVFYSLISSNRGAMLKWIGVSFLLLILECLPLLLKFYAGRSSVGRKQEYMREVEDLRLNDLRDRAVHDRNVAKAVLGLSSKAVDDIAASAEGRVYFAETFASYLRAVAPVEAVRAMMSNLASQHIDRDVFMRQFPDYAGVVAEAWSKAIKDSIVAFRADTATA